MSTWIPGLVAKFIECSRGAINVWLGNFLNILPIAVFLLLEELHLLYLLGFLKQGGSSELLALSLFAV